MLFQHSKISGHFFNYPFSKEYVHTTVGCLTLIVFHRFYMGGYFLWESWAPAADFEHFGSLANLELNVSLTMFRMVWIM